jgi:hypothetical protein
VILFDPIFQGLAISLMAGEVASLFLSRMTVPILFFVSERKKHGRRLVEPIIPPPESPAGVDGPTVEPLASFVESIAVVEPEADSEPAPGNEELTEAEHDPAPEIPGAADAVNEGESPGSTNAA